MLGGGIRLKDHWAEQRMFLGRIVAAGTVIVVLGGLLIARLFSLQVLDYAYFSDLSQGNRIRIEPIAATRGLIFDRNGILLAENLPAYQLALIPEEVTDVEETLARLLTLGLIDQADIERVRNELPTKRSFQPVPLRYRLDEQEVALFAVNRPYFPGVDFQYSLIRHYPHGGDAVHAVGYVGGATTSDLERLGRAAYAGTTHVGKVGIERRYEAALHGAVGYQQVRVNARGKRMEEFPGTLPQPGRDLYLSIDITLQQAALTALAEYRGAVVAIDPRNGEVLALVSAPVFDPNPFAIGLSPEQFRILQDNPQQPMFNRAIRGQYPPGSTIKPIMALAGLDTGILDPDHRTICPGFFRLPGHSHRYRDWKPAGHGEVDWHQAIVESCDVFFYELAMGLGIDRMHDWLVVFGLGQPSNIDIRGESRGLVPSRAWKQSAFSDPGERVWFPGETVIAGIGQGFLLATPLQLAGLTAAIAARGQRFKPTLMTAVTDPLSGQTRDTEPAPAGAVDLNDAALWDRIHTAMRGVTQAPRGTARAIAVGAEYEIAGKSGTAQVFSASQDEIIENEDLPERLRDHALFIAFAPATFPEIAVAVVVENGGSGSGVAAPVARAVLDAYFGDG